MNSNLLLFGHATERGMRFMELLLQLDLGLVRCPPLGGQLLLVLRLPALSARYMSSESVN